MKQPALSTDLLPASRSNPLETNGYAVPTPSLDTVQQVDIARAPLADEFRRLSLAKGERWASRSSAKQKLVERARRIDKAIADKLAKCCSSFSALTCGVHTVRAYPTYRCKKLFCPDCAPERAARLSHQTEAKIREAMKATSGRLCLLTLTSRNTPTLSAGLLKLKKDFAKFKRRKDYRQRIKGYFGGFEYTFNPQSKDFNVHLHLIVLRGAFWNQAEISDAWREVTGDSFVVDIREIRNIHKGAKELCKYICKPSDLLTMPDAKLREVMMMKSGTRMFVSGGCFYNVKLDETDETDENIFNQFAELTEGDACPLCNQELFQLVVTREQHIGLHELNAMPAVVKNNSS
jgi:hypothetical protein